jgi:lysophospholipase L1-like esterase
MKRRIVPGGILALRLAVVLLAATGASPAEGASPGGLYVALGDSAAATPWRPPGGNYVDRLFLHYQSTLGVTKLSNRAKGGETSSSIRTGGQLDSALADINAVSDTRAVTIDIGGNDRFECAGWWPSCPFRYNFFATLSELKAALDSDPGPESFTAMAYYNPASGTAGEGQYLGLLGTDSVIDCEITAGTGVGANDIIYQEAGRRGVLVADPYLAFKAGGQSFMADAIHPNDAGHAAIAAAFREASPVCPEAGGLPPPNELVESVPPDLQLSGPKRQKLGNAVKVKASCGDEACIAHAEGKLTKVKNDQLQPTSFDLDPGETTTLALKLRPCPPRICRQATSQRKQVRKALAEGKKVQAKVKAALGATDAFGQGWVATRAIKLVK